ncbi:MAG: class I SAM-dependent methyltransferase [Fibrobacter sp.]|jgi:SAM-dependent methyltransferase|nr:class I SAM-dependent methyltransferase [Fibrobacter sp.]
MGKLQGQSSFFVPGPPAKPGEAHKPIVDFLLKEVRGKSVLDLGGGEGAYSLEMKKAGFDTTVADINEKSLAVAEQNGLKTKLLEPGESLGENLADTVMMIEVLEHVPDPAGFLKSAVGAAKKRVLFSLPCTDDFKTLFENGLTYAHIAVSDHLWHFSHDELKQLLDSLGEEYRLTMGDYLFPGVGIKFFRDCLSGPLGFILVLPFRVLNKFGVIPKRYPSRFYGIIEKG